MALLLILLKKYVIIRYKMRKEKRGRKMTRERLSEIKMLINERTNYYSNIGFVNLANEFTILGNFVAEVEDLIKETEELKARIQTMEASIEIPATKEENK